MKSTHVCMLILFLAIVGHGNSQPAAQEPGPQKVKATTKSIARTDAKAMETFFDITSLSTPTKTSWVQRARRAPQDEGVPAPSDYYVVAILEYDAPQIAISKKLAKRGDVYVEDQLLEDWMPKSIVERFVRTDGYLKFDGEAYKASTVMKPTLSYGYILLIGNYVFLYGTTL